jgi:sodium transport system ATP-binding protein
MTDAVLASGLSKYFYDEGRGEVRAVDGVDFTCRAGEILGLLGANGAGKTTTLRMLATILVPTSGTATVMGHDVATAPQAVRAQIGFCTASTALYPRLTARETIAFFGELGGIPREALSGRVDSLIERFGIGAYAEARIEKLSSGMKQKVSIARTVVHDPPVLIFDEPTVGLDVLNALEMRKAIAGLRDEGKAILYSTHIMSEAEQLCDRIAIIHGGRIHACNTLAGLRESTGCHYLEDIFVRYAQAGATGA